MVPVEDVGARCQLRVGRDPARAYLRNNTSGQRLQHRVLLPVAAGGDGGEPAQALPLRRLQVLACTAQRPGKS
eukprot:COSAG01_NODE_45875_length_405_cov_1.189542_2_plen_72_part_01